MLSYDGISLQLHIRRHFILQFQHNRREPMKKQSLFARASTLIGALALVLTLSPTAQAQSQTGTAAIGTASGITVFGYGDASAPADLAHVTLTFPSTNASYGPTGPVFEPVDEEEVSQIVEVLVANGVTSDTLNVNIFG